MSGQNQNFGLMDQAYFVSRSQILTWVNELLKLNISKIEELGSGAVYCQIFDAIYPGKVTMSKVNWKAKVDYQFLNNYKILQAVFDKFGIKKYVEVEKLSKAKYQDNLQFIQWCKRYYEVNGGDKSVPYPAEDRRGSVKVDFGYAEKIVVPKNFNAVGQVIPKNKNPSKEKRGDSGALASRESAKRHTSPTNPANLQKGKSPVHQKKVTQQKEAKEAKQVKPAANGVPHYPPPPHKKLQQKKQASEQSLIRPQKGSIQELQKYKKIVRDLQSKIQMITEIAQSNDQADMKMKLIEQVLSISVTYSKLAETQGKLAESQGKQAESRGKQAESQGKLAKHMETIKSEEFIEESIKISRQEDEGSKLQPHIKKEEGQDVKVVNKLGTKDEEYF